DPSATGAITAVERNAQGATAWPSDCATSAASSRASPLPPHVSGTTIPAAPSSASPRQIARSFGQAAARSSRTRAIGTLSRSQPRTLCSSRRWSSERPKSILLGLRDLRLAGQPEPALRDDVPLDLRGAATDDQPEREERVGLPEPLLALVLRVVVEAAELAHCVDRERRDVEAELAVRELHHEPRDARGLAAQAAREQAHAVVLHRVRARLEPHQPVAVDGARDRGRAI